MAGMAPMAPMPSLPTCMTLPAAWAVAEEEEVVVAAQAQAAVLAAEEVAAVAAEEEVAAPPATAPVEKAAMAAMEATGDPAAPAVPAVPEELAEPVAMAAAWSCLWRAARLSWGRMRSSMSRKVEEPPGNPGSAGNLAERAPPAERVHPGITVRPAQAAIWVVVAETAVPEAAAEEAETAMSAAMAAMADGALPARSNSMRPPSLRTPEPVSWPTTETVMRMTPVWAA